MIYICSSICEASPALILFDPLERWPRCTLRRAFFLAFSRAPAPPARPPASAPPKMDAKGPPGVILACCGVWVPFPSLFPPNRTPHFLGGCRPGSRSRTRSPRGRSPPNHGKCNFKATIFVYWCTLSRVFCGPARYLQLRGAKLQENGGVPAARARFHHARRKKEPPQAPQAFLLSIAVAPP